MKHHPTCVCVNLRRLARTVTQIYDDALAQAGIKITQFSLLRAVERNQPVAISALAQELELDRTTLARNLRPLERDRLVTLSAGTDQRVTEVSLTPAGRAAIRRALPLWQRAQANVARRIGEKKISALQTLAANLVEE